jgi:hypothetical protein
MPAERSSFSIAADDGNDMGDTNQGHHAGKKALVASQSRSSTLIPMMPISDEQSTSPGSAAGTSGGTTSYTTQGSNQMV